MRAFRFFVAVVAVSLLSGCFSNYYEVKDPSSDKVYYTTKFNEKREGSVSFQDEKTGASVTIQNSEIREIKKDEFKEGVSNE